MSEHPIDRCPHGTYAVGLDAAQGKCQDCKHATWQANNKPYHCAALNDTVWPWWTGCIRWVLKSVMP